MLRAKDRHKHN